MIIKKGVDFQSSKFKALISIALSCTHTKDKVIGKLLQWQTRQEGTSCHHPKVNGQDMDEI